MFYKHVCSEVTLQAKIKLTVLTELLGYAVKKSIIRSLEILSF